MHMYVCDNCGKYKWYPVCAVVVKCWHCLRSKLRTVFQFRCRIDITHGFEPHFYHGNEHRDMVLVTIAVITMLQLYSNMIDKSDE